MQHLRQRGHQRLAVILDDRWNPGDNLFMRGVQHVLDESADVQCSLQVQSVRSEPALIESLTRRMLGEANRPTAVLTRTDEAAVAILHAAKAMGLDVPKDLAIVSGGKGTPILCQCDPPITGMTDCHGRVAEVAARLLLDIIGGRKLANSHIEIPAELVPRGST